MPRETIIIRISKLPFPEPGAMFIAKLAFPNDPSKKLDCGLPFANPQF